MQENKKAHGYTWGGRSPDGKINPDSLDDIQKWYHSQGAITATQPMDKVLDQSFAQKAVAKLGPYTPSNAASKEAGCR